MSTHNIVFYEEISKVIPYLSSNINYAPYLFFCNMQTILPIFDEINDAHKKHLGHMIFPCKLQHYLKKKKSLV